MKRLDVKILMVILFAVLLPLGFSVFLVAKVVDTSLGLGLNYSLALQFERSLEAEQKNIKLLKAATQMRFSYLCDSVSIDRAAGKNKAELKNLLNSIIESDDLLQRIELTSETGVEAKVTATQARTEPEYRTLTKYADVEYGPYNNLTATFAVKSSIFENYKSAGADISTYKALVEAPPSYLKERFLWVYLAILTVCVVISILVGMLWTRRMVRRVHRLSRATLLVADGDLSVRVKPGPPDEVGKLVEAFNGMVGELAVNRTRIEYLQKISAWQEVARRLAHEIKNPLTPIHLAAQQLRKKYNGDDPSFKRLLDQSTEIIEEEVETLRRLTTDFSSFAKLPSVKPDRVDLGEFLNDCETTQIPQTEQEGVSIVVNLPSVPLPVLLDRILMKRVVDNLIRNATESMVQAETESPQIIITAKLTKRKKSEEIELLVEDNGPGVPEQSRASIFDPYYTTKSEGTGLGLAISKKIVLEHGGRIWLDEVSIHGGATFVIALPVG